MKRFLMLILAAVPFFTAADWPTYRGDVHRSGIAKESLAAPLYRQWSFHVSHAPRPAWPAPANEDVANRLRDLRAVVAYDRAFEPVIGGDMVFFGSSADDKVYALDATSGAVRWTFITGGPVRLAPTLAAGKLYVGSDDGYVYCLSAEDGKLLWRQVVHGPRRLLPGNGRMISAWPVRSSVVVMDGTAYASAGLFPREGVYLAAFDAMSGTPKWARNIKVSTQGYMAASDKRLYIPTGRTTPAVFDRADGKSAGKLPGGGGTFSLVVDDVVVSGPGVRDKEIEAADRETSESIASFNGLTMIVDGSIAYMLSEDKLTAFDRKTYLELARRRNATAKQLEDLEKQQEKVKSDRALAQPLLEKIKASKTQLAEISLAQRKCTLWENACDCPHGMIKSGDTLFLGGANKIIAVDSKAGKQFWQAPVDGTPHGLAIANGCLLASTDRGVIHCFGKSQNAAEKVTRGGAGQNPFDTPADAKPAVAAAAAALRQTGADQGYCLLLGCGDGRLAYELAKGSRLNVICVEPDAKKAAQAQSRLDRAGYLGVRVAIIQSPLDRLPLPDYFANLIVCNHTLTGNMLPPSAAEIARVLRPCGGRFLATIADDKTASQPSPSQTPTQKTVEAWGKDHFEGWQVTRSGNILQATSERGALPGSGEWTHTWGNVANTACSGDNLVGSDLQVLWFGRPGPNCMVDRHFRNAPPLYKNGRLFIPGRNTLFAVDAYNGTILWEADTPNSLRVGVFLDPCNITVDDKYLYLAAEDKCHRFDVRDGKRDILAALPQLAAQSKDKSPQEWGYIAHSGDILLGSARTKGTGYHTITKICNEVTHSLWNPNMKPAFSQGVFALDRSNGRPRWSYVPGGSDAKLPWRIIDNTFAIGGDVLYFVETTVPDLLGENACRLKMLDVVRDGRQYLTALDLGSGKVRFKQKVDMSNYEQPVFLNYADKKLLLSGSKLIKAGKQAKNIQYYYQAFDAADGKPRWKRDHDSQLRVDGGHGEYNRHPTLIGGVAYAWPYAYRLETGEQLADWKFDRRGHGCGNISASNQCMFWRGYNPWMFDLRPGGGPSRINGVTRPGCFINIIPAGGLVMIPEASSGCTCDYPLQMSLVYLPLGSKN